jgi:transposase
VVEELPWAEADSRFTRAFEDQVTWLVQRCDKTTVSTMMGIAWRTVGRIVERTVRRVRKPVNWSRVRAIGIDELSYRKGRRYLTLVTDLETGAHIWGKEGKSAATVDAFFDEIGPEACARIQVVAMDMNGAYESVVKRRLSSAVIVYDRFHVQQLVGAAVDKTRREEWQRLRGTADARTIKHTRYALLKNPWNLTQRQEQALASLQRDNRRLFRAYLLKEAFAEIFRSITAPWAARRRLKAWLSWASRSKLPAFVKAARTIRKRLEGIIRYFESGFSNGPAEGLNNKARLATRQAYGFHSAGAVLAMIDLRCSGIRIRLPRI